MSKFVVGLIMGIMVASAIAHSDMKITDPKYNYVGNGTFIKMDQYAKVFAHLDEDELKAIKEACK